MVYTTFVMAVVLHGCEAWCITAKLWRKLRLFHAQSARVLCVVSHFRQWRASISTAKLLEDLHMPTIDVYVQRRHMAWLGRMSRMDDDAIPRQMMTCWVYRRQMKAAERARLRQAGALATMGQDGRSRVHVGWEHPRHPHITGHPAGRLVRTGNRACRIGVAFSGARRKAWAENEGLGF